MAKKSGRVAVVGSGISGLSSAILLQKSGYDVTLYESEATFGGHTLTDETIPGVPVDLGFQVFNRSTYGNFEQFLEMLGVDSEESDMSFSLSVDDGRLEWGSQKGLFSIFQQKKNLVSPEFWTMLLDVRRFGREAPAVLDDESYQSMTLGQYLDKHKYSRSFTYNYVLPMCAAIWSVSNQTCLEFPIQVLVRFWVNHHLLDLIERPQWRVVKDRSRTYVDKVIAELRDARAGTPVVAVTRGGDGYVVKDGKGGADSYHHIVMATHSDVSLKLLDAVLSEGQRQVLQGIPYSQNDIYLHRDPALMPRDRGVWASWNCLDQSKLNQETASTRPVCVTYYVNSLQRLPEGAGDLFVTLNPPAPPAADKTVRRLQLAHPVFSEASRAAQQRLPAVNGEGNIWLCGAWCGYGFHEDGIKAAVAVVEGLGGEIPWVPRTTSPYMTLATRFVNASVHKMAGGAIKRGSIRLIMPNGTEVIYGNPNDAPPPGHKEGIRGALAAPCHTRVRVFDCNFFLRLAKDTDIGLGESFMYGDFEPDDLTNMLNVLVQNVESCNESQGKLGIINWLGTQMQTLAHMARANTVEGSRKNISEHYDLGNDMYKLFLDNETWMYSSGVFKSPADSLYQSQLNKLDLILDKMDLTPDHHIFEIGCGWGGFACRAVERFGCKVTGITISEEQLKYAQRKVKQLGFQDRISIQFMDYRKIPQELEGTFDRLVSIEMIEAVGHENLAEYFGIIDKMLKPGGRAVLQAITYKDKHYANYCKCSDFIRRHIFPGGHLPSMGAMLRATSKTALAVTHVEDIGLHYATTLKLWHENWLAAEQEIYKLGYTKEFFRKWRFYFSYCEAGFEQQFIHNYQIVWCKSPVSLAACIAAGGADAGGMLSSQQLLDSSVMAMVWCFLAGVAAGKYLAMLWAVPIAAAFFFVLAAACRALLPRAAPTLAAAFDADQTDQLVTSLVSAVFSCLATALLFAAMATGSFEHLHSKAAVDSLPHVTLSMWCGFSVWALWDGVRSKSSLRTSPAQSGLTVNILVLCAGALCLSRQLLVAYLCLPLLSEVHSFLMRARTIAGLMKISSPILDMLHWAALGIFRVAAHLGITAKVILDSTTFPHPVLFWIALVSMVSINILNLRLLVDLTLVQPTATLLAQDDYLNNTSADSSLSPTATPAEARKRKAD